jgi:hypothetical protein
MSIFGIAYPSDAALHDRKYTSADEALGNSVLATSGLAVMGASDGLVAKVPGTQNVSIQPCQAFIAGHRIISDAVETVTLDPGDATWPRIDVIVFESNRNYAVRNPRFTFVKGTAASAPTAPALSTTPALTQVALAYVLVPATVTVLDTATITDARVWSRGKHKHEISDVAALQTALDAKAALVHAHTIANVTGLQVALDGKAASVHGHTIAEVQDLQVSLDGKVDENGGAVTGDILPLQCKVGNILLWDGSGVKPVAANYPQGTTLKTYTP